MKHSKNDPSSQSGAQQAPTSEQPTKGAEASAKHAASSASEKEATAATVDELESIKKTLEEVQAKYDQLNDTYIRTLAEYDNYRKRTIKEKAELIKSGGESVLINVLNVVDDLDRGVKAAAEATDVTAVKEGMELIYNKFQAFLKQQGITLIETEGAAFDTDHHEAIATIPAPEEGMKGKVLDCVQKGYNLHDKVIRFAKVVVGE
jgi:molecular chaperone GrpE